ncbi:hypothetical protein PanWU01x14_298850 [Parasponia andersonii]|uniref:Uncharacterized protein n=1 Tax=Parasponia andersonii TaxID=3476 RepID=A0A2P5AUL3_PARAD|nr:hypothetical protein PanWU01x14_298850 [Parasponia andersonii]
MSAQSYMLQIKTLVDKVVAIGESISTKDHLIAVYNGLGSEYNALVASVQSRIPQPSFEEVHSLLLSYEFWLEQQSSTETLPSPSDLLFIQANLAVYRKP